MEEVDSNQVNLYGIIDPSVGKNELVQIEDIVEKPAIGYAPSNVAAIGRYIFSQRIFHFLEKREKGVGGEIQLTDAIRSLIPNETVHAFRFAGKRYDCGQKAGYVAANIACARRDKTFFKRIEKLLA